MRRVLVTAMAIVVLVAAAPPAAAPAEAARRDPPLSWLGAWEDDDVYGYSTFYRNDVDDSFFLSDTIVESFRTREDWRRAVIDITHSFGDLSGEVTVRHWGRRGEVTRSDGRVCGVWRARWKVLDPEPLQARFERAGLPPIKTKGRGTISVCRVAVGDGSTVLTSGFDLDVAWKHPRRRS